MTKTAVVLSGGGSLGAVQVGMLIALAERGVVPDLVVGASVGALNGAWLAAHPDLDGARRLAGIWASVRRPDVFPLQAASAVRGLLGRQDHLVSNTALRRLLRRHVPHERLESFPVDLFVVATEVGTGLGVLLSEGDAVEAILASSAIPGVFPPVRVGAHVLMDGGVVENTPISHAVRLGADRVYVLPTGYACDLRTTPHSALGMALHAVTLMIEQRLMVDIERFEGSCDLHVIPPLCPLSVSPLDFSHAHELVDRAHDAASAWLDAEPEQRGQQRFLGFHRHDHGARRHPTSR